MLLVTGLLITRLVIIGLRVVVPVRRVRILLKGINAGLFFTHEHHPIYLTRARGVRIQAKYAPPTTPVTTPTGSALPGQACCATTSLINRSKAPSSAEFNSVTPGLLAKRRAICGAASAMNGTGPAKETANAHSATAR